MVAPFYGVRNVSVPPPVVLKLMLLLVFDNVRAERELMATLAREARLALVSRFRSQ